MKDAHDSCLHEFNFRREMKFSWTNLKITIAGGKLSHLVQKDKIWDHGSMTEQARIIFYLVCKARASDNIELLKKQCSVTCFEMLKRDRNETSGFKKQLIVNPVIKELAVIDVQPGKKNKPDMFSALIKGVSKDGQGIEFSAQCLFVRQGNWWLLETIRTNVSVLKDIDP